MKVYISADMEGSTGITSCGHVFPGGAAFQSALRLWMADLNSLVEGCFAGGATHVLINEAHADMNYLLPGEIDPRAEFISGYLKPGNQMEGLDSSFNVAILLTHAMAGTLGTLAHSFVMTDVISMRLNGRPIGELGLNAIWAGKLGVPVGLVVGDDVTCQEARELLGDVEVVVTKVAIDQFTARCYSETYTRTALREAAEKVTRGCGRLRPLEMPGPYELELTFALPAMATLVSFIPGAERVDPRTVRFRSDDYPALMRTRVVATNLALAVRRQLGPGKGV